MPFVYPIGFMQGSAGGGGTPTATYIGSNASTGNQNVYTFADQSIGAAASDRLVVIVVAVSGGNGSILSVTADGNSMSSTRTSGSSSPQITMRQLTITTGTTADIEVTVGTFGAARCSIDIFTITGLSSTTAGATDADTADPISLSVSTSASGVAIAGAMTVTNTTATWANMTEQSDRSVESSMTVTTALVNGLSSGTLSPTCTFGSSSDPHAVLATWR